MRRDERDSLTGTTAMTMLTRYQVLDAHGRVIAVYSSIAFAETVAAKTPGSTVKPVEHPVAPLVFDLPGDDPFADLITR